MRQYYNWLYVTLKLRGNILLHNEYVYLPVNDVCMFAYFYLRLRFFFFNVGLFIFNIKIISIYY